MNRWHSWFAWFPVLIEDDEELYFVWWEEVTRRQVYIGGRYRWQYTLNKESLTHD